MIKYPHGAAESAEYLRLALPQMSKQDAGFHPVCYAVWYEYVSGINQPLRDAVDARVSGGERLDDAAIYALFRDHVAGIDTQTAQRVSDGVQRVLSDMSHSAAAAGDQATRFGHSLERWTEGLADDPLDAAARPDFTDLLAETRLMRAAVGTLQERLESSRREIVSLREQVQQAREDALSDGLTGLANRKGFDRALANCLAEIAPARRGPSLLLTDIDHFKKVNDSYGHLFGDKVLRSIAQILRDHVKGRDTAARYGGEEFVILLPDTPLDGARALAERLRATIETCRIRRTDTREALERITVSIGVAAYLPGETIDRFIERADRALYAAKNAGRNRIALAVT